MLDDSSKYVAVGTGHDYGIFEVEHFGKLYIFNKIEDKGDYFECFGKKGALIRKVNARYVRFVQFDTEIEDFTPTLEAGDDHEVSFWQAKDTWQVKLLNEY